MFSLAVMFGVFLFRKKYDKPSDYFLLLYGMIIIIPYFLLYDIWGGMTLIGLIAVAMPFLGVMIICELKFKSLQLTFFSEEFAILIIFLFSVAVVFALLVNPPANASFDIYNSYLRRLESRALYGDRTLIAYASSIVMNCMLALIFFWGVMRGKVFFLIASMFIYMGFYYIYGVKSPLLYMFFAGGFAFFLRQSGGDVKFFNFIYYVILMIFILAWLEFLFFGYSYLEDYIIRRVFYVGSYLVGAYLHVVGDDDFSLLQGLVVAKSASMYVGEDFLGSPGLNANTNAFLYMLLQYGVLGYLFAISLVGMVLVFLNSLSHRSEVFLFISLIFGVLILEQSVTTTLLSSGVGLLLVIFHFSRKREKFFFN
jgi:hypothetical protein